jgi:hypothetical protein
MTTLGDAPITDEYRELMNKLAEGLDHIFNGDEDPKKTGFVLIVFPFGTDARRCNYISNADRADVVTMLREQLARFEGMPDVTGRA